MTPRRYTAEQAKGVFEVDWPLFGELSRALALRVARAYDPEVVIGVATAGVVPGAVVAAILDREFHSLIVSRRYRTDDTRTAPEVVGEVPAAIRGRRVLVVDETCDTGDTIQLAVAAVLNAGAAEVRTAVSFKTGEYEPDFHALATESAIVLPWDREVLIDGDLVPNPLYETVLEAEAEADAAEAEEE
ncbi:MAG: phosphoribosyltransferase domain-containing protein [Gemmatimonadota bacterium]|nr:phosphoribosyltransferase domain-containing protein [Gemmatimonadota bacterium]